MVPGQLALRAPDAADGGDESPKSPDSPVVFGEGDKEVDWTATMLRIRARIASGRWGLPRCYGRCYSTAGAGGSNRGLFDVCCQRAFDPRPQPHTLCAALLMLQRPQPAAHAHRPRPAFWLQRRQQCHQVNSWAGQWWMGVGVGGGGRGAGVGRRAASQLQQLGFPFSECAHGCVEPLLYSPPDLLPAAARTLL